MLNNVPVKKMTHNGLTIEGYSRAAVQSYWRIPEMRLGFDLGAHPWDFMGTPNWFISHTHLDHIAALPVYVARRRMMKMEPPTIYVPARSKDAIQQMLDSFQRLDRGRLPCELVPVEPGQEILLSRELAITVHKMQHTLPALGYTVWERRKKLKPEYLGLSGDEIRDVRKTGVEVSEERRTPKVAYLGDSTIGGLDAHPEMYEAEILILEITFVLPEHRGQLIKKMGHIHLDDIVARQEKFGNQVVIAGHFSTRYHPRQIRNVVEKRLPGMLDGRLNLWI